MTLIWKPADGDHLIDPDSLNETVNPKLLFALITVTLGAPPPAVDQAVLDFVRAKLFAIRELLPSVMLEKADLCVKEQ